MFVAGRPVTQVIAQVHCLRQSIAEPGKLGEHICLVVGRAGREIILEQQHLLAHVPLDGQAIVGCGRQYLVQRGQQRSLVGGQVRVTVRRAHVHIRRGHRRGQRHLEQRSGGYDAGTLHAGVQIEGLQRRLGVARGEIYGGGIDAGLEADVGSLPQQLTVPPVQGVGRLVRVRFHRRMPLQHFPLEPDPAPAATRFTVGDAAQVRTPGFADGAENCLRVGQRETAHQVRPAPCVSHNCSGKPDQATNQPMTRRK